MKLLENKVAIVTGAGSGIGRAIALSYAREGAKVVVSDVDDSGGQESVEMITAEGGTGSYLRADVAKVEDNAALVDYAVKQYGGLHIACNNAGIAGAAAFTGEYPIDGWDKVIAINLSGVFYGMRYQIPAMLKSGGGAIVNMASILGHVGFRTAPAYVAAKHGVVGLTKTAAAEYGPQHIRMNAVGPAFIKTPLIATIDENVLLPLHPIGRLGLPEEVAELVLFLSSEKSSFITGAYYPVDGGYLAV